MPHTADEPPILYPALAGLAQDILNWLTIPDQILESVTRLESQVMSLQETVTQLESRVAGLAAGITDMKTRVAEDFAHVKGQLEALQTEVANLDPQGIADRLTGVIEAIDQAAAEIAGVDPDTDFPAAPEPEPVPEPEPEPES